MKHVSDRPQAGLSRRSFLLAGAAAGGGLLIGVSFDPASAKEAAKQTFVPNAFIRIETDGTIILTMPYVEMGQGTYTSVPMLIAEELEVDLDGIQLEHAPANDALYGHPIMGAQETDGSLSMRAAWEPMRQAGAAARMMLVSAAAVRWGVEAADCHAESGFVVHGKTNRRVGYGDIAADAATMSIPEQVVLKDPSSFKLIGTPQKRLDAPQKVAGATQYGIDVRLPGMKIAAVVASPVLGGQVTSVDDGATRKIAGVRDVIRIHDAVAVIADHWAAAKKGLDALVVTWDDGPNAQFSTAQHMINLENAAHRDGVVAVQKGDVAGVFSRAERRLEADYRLPILAHAPMEPLNCTAHIHDGKCEVWLGTQAASRAQKAAAAAAGLPLDRVEVHNQYLGGSFGRRAEADNVTQAVLIARQVDYPVKVIWSREEDTQHDFYRPAYFNRLKASLDSEGHITSWFHRVVGPSPLARWLPIAVQNGLDPDAVTSATGPYELSDIHVDYVRHEDHSFQSGFWRGVGTTHNVFIVEGFVDELAALSGKDPLEFRREHVKNNPRALAVLDKAVEESGWGTPLPEGTGRGISLLQDFGGTILVHIAEATVDDAGAVRVSKVTSVVDCGKIINPDTVKAQIQGGAIFGLSAALYGEITFNNGRVDQGNFDTYAAVRMDEAPRVTVHLIDSGDKPFGVGESGTSGIGPAVANAVYAATGKRVRQLPVTPELLKS
ncbi:xanthine dehydrogenase family protein molybdopterin-binding subunit [Sinorhizobium sp. 8-89]|uniref:xanthine dehydrogenase family protein molybdopterin-binding subunit n=1 Tax=Sinorhizobium sp. 7-81 TaxID=3049087 RepID=UPI0024C29AE1|nr:xanthine dehydrogenase family protein molybdopterin-binding subunit [Sinorhizobium sp. 7-81]MDK1386551.1 xanthine dehydrogenase family protein molybdopterin-binding subunit [Sinorhizobium sp. 7-81]